MAAAALVDIAENGKSEVARVQASTAVLDRVGLATPKERPQVTFHVIPQEFNEVGIGAAQLSPAEVIRGRLAKLGKTMAGLAAAGAQPGLVVEEQQDGAAGAAGADGWADWQVDGDGDGDGDGGEVIDAEIVPDVPGADDPADTDTDPWG